MSDELDARVNRALRDEIAGLPFAVTEHMVQERLARTSGVPTAWMAALPAAVLAAVVVLGLIVGAPLWSTGDPPESASPSVEPVQPPRSRAIAVLSVRDVAEAAELVLIDMWSGRTVTTVDVGHDPVLAASPRGDRLYVLSSFGADAATYEAQLQARDPNDLSLLRSAPVPDRWHHRLPASDGMALSVSPDGDRVYAVTAWSPEPGDNRYGIAAFDGEVNEVFGRVELPCLPSATIPTRTGVLVGCSEQQRLVEVTADGRLTAVEPGGPSGGTVAGVSLEGSGRILLVGRGGHIQELDSSFRVVREARLDRGVRAGALAVAGDRVAIGLRQSGEAAFSEVAMIGLDDLGLAEVVELPEPAWSIAAVGSDFLLTHREAGSVILRDGSAFDSVATYDVGAALSLSMPVRRDDPGLPTGIFMARSPIGGICLAITVSDPADRAIETQWWSVGSSGQCETRSSDVAITMATWDDPPVLRVPIPLPDGDVRNLDLRFTGRTADEIRLHEVAFRRVDDVAPTFAPVP